MKTHTSETPAEVFSRAQQCPQGWITILNEATDSSTWWPAGSDRLYHAAIRFLRAWSVHRQLHEGVRLFLPLPEAREHVLKFIETCTNPLMQQTWMRALAPDERQNLAKLMLDRYLVPAKAKSSTGTPRRVAWAISAIELLYPQDQPTYQGRLREHLKQWESKLARQRRPPTTVWKKTFRELPVALNHTPHPKLLAQCL